MIYIRDDDVLIDSSSYPDPLARFKQIHRWICEDDHFLHVPAILLYHRRGTRDVVETRGIKGFPEAIEFIQSETKAGRMRPEIHGVEHIDYGKLHIEEVMAHLRECKEYLWKTFGVEATKFYTPWGASQLHLHEGAALEGLKLVDTSKINKLPGRYGVCRHLMDGGSFDIYEEDDIFLHWFEGGLRLQRVIKAHKYGSWAKAAEAEPDLYA